MKNGAGVPVGALIPRMLRRGVVLRLRLWEPLSERGPLPRRNASAAIGGAATLTFAGPARPGACEPAARERGIATGSSCDGTRASW